MKVARTPPVDKTGREYVGKMYALRTSVDEIQT